MNEQKNELSLDDFEIELENIGGNLEMLKELNNEIIDFLEDLQGADISEILKNRIYQKKYISYAVEDKLKSMIQQIDKATTCLQKA